ncbi:MAG: hypothetical protein WBA77_01595 [Microcoleaceae cyanobacterium]
MEIKELKFLLKLLGQPQYRAKITELSPTSATKASERDKICRDLCDRLLVERTEEITKFAIAPAGEPLLKLDSTTLPINEQELKALKACEKETISPGKTGIPAASRQEVISSLVERGFIKAIKVDIKEVWLTQQGKDYLAREYTPEGKGNVTLTKVQIGNYVNFLRDSFSPSPLQIEPSTATPTLFSDQKISDGEILQIIIDLDKKWGTDNYLPIFHLRERLQPPLTREELDGAIYRLQKQNRIELSALSEGMRYTSEQFDTGILLPGGTRLFFIIVH